ncbi:MAG: hypothetical protein EHM93_13815 [Bacteroidales bacterium]|nr:MAG: hypothetical protein EHM93_13815 [Bacteroidales bacterium]
MNNNLSHANESLPDTELFTSKLKKEDEYNLNISKSFFWIYIGFIGLYSIMMIVNIIFDRGFIRMFSQIFFILSFVSFILIFRYNLKIYKKIDYTLPLSEMLSAVVKRYQLRLGHFLIILIPIILMDAGLTLTFYEDLSPMNPLYRVLIVQVFYIPIMVISALIGILIWRKKQKPLKDRAIQLLEELESF